MFSSKSSNSLMPYNVARGSKKDESNAKDKSKGSHDDNVGELEDCSNKRLEA